MLPEEKKISGHQYSLTDDDHKRLSKMMMRVNRPDIFEFEGNYYFGDWIEALKRFVVETSHPSDFKVFADDNYKKLTPNQ